MKDLIFDKALSKAKLSTWQSLKLVVINLLVNHWSAEYEIEIEALQKNFHQNGAWMSVKLHFLRSYSDHFSKNCGDLSEEQDEHFHPDICIMEECF